MALVVASMSAWTMLGIPVGWEQQKYIVEGWESDEMNETWATWDMKSFWGMPKKKNVFFLQWEK